jgi:hypothetical protein
MSAPSVPWRVSAGYWSTTNLWQRVSNEPGDHSQNDSRGLAGGLGTRQLQAELRPSERPTKEDYGQTFEYNYAERLFQGGMQVMPQEEVRNTPNWDEDVGALMLLRGTSGSAGEGSRIGLKLRPECPAGTPSRFR